MSVAGEGLTEPNNYLHNVQMQTSLAGDARKASGTLYLRLFTQRSLPEIYKQDMISHNLHFLSYIRMDSY